LKEKIAQLEERIAIQKAAENSTADSRNRSDQGSEHETDSDVRDSLYSPILSSPFLGRRRLH